MPLSVPLPALAALASLVALASCAALIDTRADSREAAWEAAAPPVGRFVEVEGRRIHLVVAGQPRGAAPDIVLIHGANGNLRDFTFDLVTRLEGDFRVIIPDRPGLGHSDSWGAADSDPREQARILRAVAEEVGVDRPILLGHSYGGAVATAWALQARDEAAALVLLGAATMPWPGTLGPWYRLNDTPLGRPARALVAAFAPPSALEQALDSVFAPAPAPEGYGDHIGAGLALRRAAQATNTRQVNALLDHVTAMQPHYADLTLPVELVHGEADTIVGLDIHSRRFAREVPAAHLTVLPEAGHMPHHTHPSEVLAAIHRARRRAGL